MRVINKVAVLCFVLFGSNAFASSYEMVDSAYVSLGGGLGKYKSIKNSSLPITSKVSITMTEPNELGLDYKKSYLMRASVGANSGNIRTEVEALYLKASYKQVTAGNGVYNFNNVQGNSVLPGYTSSLSGFINGFYDFPVHDMVLPYLGLGIGVSRIKNHIELDATPVLKATMKEYKLTYQAIAGVRLNLTSRLGLMTDYRYLGTGNVKALNSKLRHQSINLSLFYKF